MYKEDCLSIVCGDCNCKELVVCKCGVCMLLQDHMPLKPFVYIY